MPPIMLHTTQNVHTDITNSYEEEPEGFRRLPPQPKPSKLVMFGTFLIFMLILALVLGLVYLRIKLQNADACAEYATSTISSYTFNDGTTTKEVSECTRYGI